MRKILKQNGIKSNQIESVLKERGIEDYSEFPQSVLNEQKAFIEQVDTYKEMFPDKNLSDYLDLYVMVRKNRRIVI